MSIVLRFYNADHTNETETMLSDWLSGRTSTLRLSDDEIIGCLNSYGMMHRVEDLYFNLLRDVIFYAADLDDIEKELYNFFDDYLSDLSNYDDSSEYFSTGEILKLVMIKLILADRKFFTRSIARKYPFDYLIKYANKFYSCFYESTIIKLYENSRTKYNMYCSLVGTLLIFAINSIFDNAEGERNLPLIGSQYVEMPCQFIIDLIKDFHNLPELATKMSWVLDDLCELNKMLVDKNLFGNPIKDFMDLIDILKRVCDHIKKTQTAKED